LLEEPGTGRSPSGLDGPGSLVLIVGPSGAGKDTLIAYARRRLANEPQVVFPRRVVTREPDPALEDHAGVAVETFQAMLAARRFALSWKAHGLYYGVPAEIDTAITAGSVVVVNVSREVVATARRLYAHVLAVLVTAPPHVLAHRLSRRGREGAAEIKGRLARGDAGIPGALVTLVNDGPVERAGEELAALLLRESAAAAERIAAREPVPA